VIEIEAGICIFFILPVNTPMNILGMPLFSGYYTIHDPIDGKVGFAPHSASKKDSLRSGPIPSPTRFLEVGGPTKKEISNSAFWISWGLCAILGYSILSFWGEYYSV
jgi:hypothetical protein